MQAGGVCVKYGEAVCDNPECGKIYSKRTSNQRYCNEFCQKKITNENLKKKYHEARARIKGQVRYCSRCGETRLNRYNESDVCNLCEAKQKRERREDLLAMFNGA